MSNKLQIEVAWTVTTYLIVEFPDDMDPSLVTDVDEDNCRVLWGRGLDLNGCEERMEVATWSEEGRMSAAAAALDEDLIVSLEGSNQGTEGAASYPAFLKYPDSPKKDAEVLRVTAEHAAVSELMAADDVLCRLGFVEAFQVLKARADEAVEMGERGLHPLYIVSFDQEGKPSTAVQVHPSQAAGPVGSSLNSWPTFLPEGRFRWTPPVDEDGEWDGCEAFGRFVALSTGEILFLMDADAGCLEAGTTLTSEAFHPEMGERLELVSDEHGGTP